MSRRKPPPAARREVALFRYSLVRPLVDPRLSALERGELVRSLADRHHMGPAGELVWVSRSTLDRWARILRLEGFEALMPRPRQVTPRTAAGLLEQAVALKRERPARTATQVARIMRQAHGRGPSARTLQRHFARLGLDRHAEAVGAPQTFGRFEADFPDELWLSDGLHAGAVRGPTIEGRSTVLAAILDDHARYVVAGRWGFAEDTVSLQAALHDAVKVQGCPVGFYCDNGSVYVSNQLAWSLAVLDIKIVHSRVGRPQGRGKIERWNRTCREEFLVEIETGTGTGGSPVASLAELNRLFRAWLHQVYHRRVHSETGQTPTARYHQRGADAPPPRRPSIDTLRRAFLWRETRTVTSWRTVSLLGNNYEVDPALVGREVDLLFNPFDLERIDVEYHGRPMGQARPHKVSRHVHPDVKAPTKKPPAQATGIDYLRLLDAAQQAELGAAINFAALAEPDNPTTTEASTDGEDT
ncbi:MAG TPA: DDE-type integrase/transposase/recombinase [Mycobacterium sp.]|nr:DDE-type integrase/transposase/recombinase [Mycobacterium sp.]